MNDYKKIQLYEQAVKFELFEDYDGMRKIVTELKTLVSGHREDIRLSENDLCLFNDLCNDLGVD